jgi:transposase
LLIRLDVAGASGFTYAQATWTQGLANWIGGHVGAFEAIGGVPAPENTNVAVIKACLYDPQINRSRWRGRSPPKHGAGRP